MTTLSYSTRFHARRLAGRVLALAPGCFACASALMIGPSRRRGFCADCWERSRLGSDDELGGES